MKRLTGKYLGRTGLVDNLNVQCLKICNQSFCESCPIQKAFDKLAHYEDLEEQGLLLELPCKVGDKVYIITHLKKSVLERTVDSIHFGEGGIFVGCEEVTRLYIWNEQMFATKEEAEQKLKELQEKEI